MSLLGRAWLFWKLVGDGRFLDRFGAGDFGVAFYGDAWECFGLHGCLNVIPVLSLSSFGGQLMVFRGNTTDVVILTSFTVR